MFGAESDDDGDDYAGYGTPLEPLDEETVHKQKAPRLEDQIVTDEEGRRRFHGAFTGGFSAGYFNSAGSKEGWTPSSFVSSRSSRAQSSGLPSSKPQDFMDEEDLRDHGIAPQGLKPTSSYETEIIRHKRRREVEVSGPIPGKPVLEDFLRPTRETVGMKLLMKLGWRPGQGIGPRISKRSKQMARNEQKKFYPKTDSSHKLHSDDSETDSEDDEAALAKEGFAPDDIETTLLETPKANFFGLGYQPLERTNILGFMNSSEPGSLKIKGKSIGLSIKGHAFGVGAFEDEDEDIYEKEDMSRYDFALGSGEDQQNLVKQASQSKGFHEFECISERIKDFTLSSKPYEKPKIYSLPVIPSSFTLVHQSRRRRFDITESESRGLGRHDLTSEDRRRIIAPSHIVTAEIRMGVKEAPPPIDRTSDSGIPEDESSGSVGASSRFASVASFKPFSKDPEKQKRYETYLKFRDRGMKDQFHCIQLSAMTEWEKENEKRTFERAASLYAPLTSSMAARFTSASFQECDPDLKDGLNDVTGKLSSKSTVVDLKGDESDDRKKAAKAKMFGQLTQTRVDWHPDKIVCKRFNVPNPYPDSSVVGVPHIKKEKVSIFNFLCAPLSQTAGLQSATPVVTSTQSSNVMEASRSSEGEEKEATAENISTKEMEDDHEDYGLKISTTGPPTMDLYKAIFANDSESESDDETSNLNVGETSRNIYEKGEHGDKNTGMTSGAKIKQQSQENADLDVRSVINSGRETAVLVNKSSSSQAVSKISSVHYSNLAKGVFKNIDFEALNEYRNTSYTASQLSTPATANDLRPEREISQGTESEGMQSGDDEEEYGPALPPSRSTDTSLNSEVHGFLSTSQRAPRSAFPSKDKKKEIWIEKSSHLKKEKNKHHKHKKKSKKKKNKKEKKSKDSKDHRKRECDSSYSSSSDDN